MKKIMLLVLFLSPFWGYSQVKNYAFSQTTGTYNELATADGTVLGDSNSDSQYFVDSNALLGGLTSTGNGFTIPFDFVFNGDTYNRFAVSNEGWISLGHSSKSPAVNATVANSLQPLSSSTTAADFYMAKIAALANDLVAQSGSSLIYSVQGTSPNRVLVVQWKNYRKKNNGDGDSFNFQIRLKEASNVVEIDYGTFVNNGNPLSFQVGLRGGSATLNNVSNRSSNNGWINTQSGTDITDTVLLSSTYKPDSGTAFTWTPSACGGTKALVVSNVNSSSASISWGAYTPTPTGYEYVVSTSSSTPTAAGTSSSTAAGTLSGLSANTGYNVFVRTTCGVGFTPWLMLGSFTTCSDVTSVSETFNYTSLPINNYPKPNTYFMPPCWSTKGSTANGTVGVVNGGTSGPSSTTNRLLLNTQATANDYACAMLPSISNLQAANYQLRFKAGASVATGKSVQIGYFADAASTVFTQIAGGSFPLDDTLREKTLLITGVPAGIKNLVFRVSSDASSLTNVYLDDVSYELKNDCPNVTALLYKQPTDSSVKVAWTVGGSETQWQYVYALASASADPSILNINNVTSGLPEAAIGNLNSNTSYNVWVRTVCPTSGYGSWVGPLTATTACSAVASVMENFDTYTSGLPACWTKVSATGGIGVTTSTYGITPPNPALSNANKLWINGWINSSNTSVPAVVAFPALTNLKDPNYQLKMNIATDDVTKTKFEIGYVTDLTDLSTFKPIYNDISCAANKVFEYRTFNLGTVPAEANYLAFRAVGNGYYLDDIVWEPSPTACPNIVSDINAVEVKNGNAILKWTTVTSESQWQYALGSSTDVNPYLLTAKNFVSLDTSKQTLANGYVKGTVDQLSPNTVYKVWIKAVCDATHTGSYVGPYLINTTCDQISDFVENFDSLPNGQKLPNCWIPGKTGSVGAGYPASYKAPSGSTVLILGSTNVSGVANDAIVTLPAVNNANDGTHMLVFYYRTTSANSILNIGYMKNPSDASSFIAIDGLSFNGNIGDFTRAVAIIPQDISSSVLAFRNQGSVANTTYIDNVSWQIIPACPDIKDLTLNTTTHNSITASWTTGSGETQWEYVVGDTTVDDPLTLTPVSVNDNDPSSDNNVISITDSAPNVPLQPQTTYRVWVRSRCSTGKPGNYVGPISATTTCAPSGEFYEDFEGVTSPTLPNCWQKVGIQGTASTIIPGIQLLMAEPGYNRRLYMEASSTNAQPVVSMPTIDISTFDTHILKFWVMSRKTHRSLEVGFLTNPADPNSFVSKKTINVDGNWPFEPIASQYIDSKLIILDKDDLGTPPESAVLAFRNPGVEGESVLDPLYKVGVNGIYIDKVSWTEAPTAAPVLAGSTVTKDAACGNYANTISWTAAPGADGYKISLGTSVGNYDIMDSVDLGNVLQTTFTGNIKTTYYYIIAPYNYAGSNPCAEQTFLTAANNCFCVSKPTSVHDKGITAVRFSGKNFNVSVAQNEPYYHDFSNTLVNVPKTGKVDLLAILNTAGNVYNMGVWVDFNDDYQFDASERMVSQLSEHDAGAVTDISFIMPQNSTTGVHYVRLSCRNGKDADPCYNGELGETLDFKMNVVDPIANDETTGAIPLTPGTVFETNPVEATNINATGSYAVTMPVCGTYSGADVWFRAVVPASGNLTFEVNSVTGGLTNTAGALYGGDDFKLIECNDSSSTAGDDHPKISVSGRTAGETLYFRVWDNGGDDYAAFKVSAYDDTPADVLGTDIFNTLNFNYYPNPVKDVLNISFDKEISRVFVINLLGQTVIGKSVNSNQSTVDMSGLSKGAYLVKVTSGNQTKTIKVIKE